MKILMLLKKSHLTTLLIAGLMMLSLPAYADVMPFPKMQGEVLSGDEKSYPQDFGGKPHVVIMSFDRNQEKQIEGWIKAASDLPDGVSLFEIALIGEVGGIARFFIKGGMRDLPAYKKRRDVVMPYFGDAELVKNKLNVTDISKVRAYLVNEAGQIIWQAKGSYDGQYKSLPSMGG